MPFMVEMMSRNCISCNKEVYCFFRSQEEFDNFKCESCLNHKDETNEPIEEQLNLPY